MKMFSTGIALYLLGLAFLISPVALAPRIIIIAAVRGRS